MHRSGVVPHLLSREFSIVLKVFRMGVFDAIKRSASFWHHMRVRVSRHSFGRCTDRRVLVSLHSFGCLCTGRIGLIGASGEHEEYLVVVIDVGEGARVCRA